MKSRQIFSIVFDTFKQYAAWLSSLLEMNILLFYYVKFK